MRQRDLDRSVARATGEAVTTISRMGFVPLWPEEEREPRFIDWDQLEFHRNLASPPQERDHVRATQAELCFL